MELVAPAGDIEKLETVYRYGADAAYIGLGGFSLRHRADEIDSLARRADRLRLLKSGRRLYGALNIYFRDADLRLLEGQIDLIASLPLDGLILTDPGVVPILRAHLPAVPLHLSTQANCMNSEAALVYRDLGFSRIIAAREMSLAEIAALKSRVPDLEIEAFVHGAMCLAYSGRCLLSAWQAGRSANRGDCAHSCRWSYRHAIEEEQRPGEYYPVVEGDRHTTILSPRDLCMIAHMEELRTAGVDAVKIEGRMKSVYYAAIVTRAYRKEIDRVAAGRPPDDSRPFVEDLYRVSHRDYSTGFYFGDPEALSPAAPEYHQTHRLVATVRERIGPGRYRLDVKNALRRGDDIEYVGPHVPAVRDRVTALFDPDGRPASYLNHQNGGSIEPSVAVDEGYLIRRLREPGRLSAGDGSATL